MESVVVFLLVMGIKVTSFATACHWFLPKSDELTPHLNQYPIILKSILVSSFHLCLDLPSGKLPLPPLKKLPRNTFYFLFFISTSVIIIICTLSLPGSTTLHCIHFCLTYGQGKRSKWLLHDLNLLGLFRES